MSKLDTAKEYFVMAALFTKQDIFAQTDNESIWKPLREKVEIKVY